MIEKPFPIECEIDGKIFLRGGLVFVMFMKKRHEEIVDNVRHLFEDYIQLIGQDTLRWVHDRGEYYKPLTPKKLKRIHQLLTTEAARKRPNETLELKDGEDEWSEGEHYFLYGGRDLRRPTGTSFIEIRLPVTCLEEKSPDDLVDFATALAVHVPYTSGYLSLALNYVRVAESLAAREVNKYAFKHPGIDINNTIITAGRIDRKVRGAYWLTLLGEEPLSMLGPKDVLISKLPAEVEVNPVGTGIMLRAGNRPSPGDINRGNNLPLIRSVAKAIEPVMLFQTSGFFCFESEDFSRWERRHLD